MSSKLVPARERKENEQEDWERFSDVWKNGKDLLLAFDEKSIGLRCVLDHALFLSGKTKDGKAVAGAKAIKVKGCDIKKPYVTPKKDHGNED